MTKINETGVTNGWKNDKIQQNKKLCQKIMSLLKFSLSNQEVLK